MPLNPKKTPMPVQDSAERVKNFTEVALGYSEEEALREAERCLECKNPLCKQGCPVEVPIPEFIRAIKDKDYNKAVEILKSKNNLPAICGRVCPQESQCELHCIVGKKHEPVGIGRLERWVADWDLARESQVKAFEAKKGKVAVVGAGPAGLTAAADLARMGYQVTIFEAFHKPGGVLVYGIPEFRLPKNIVEQEVEYIKKLGVELKLNYIIGKTKDVDELFEEGYQAVFVATGAGLPKFMNIPGENLNGVYSANEFLTRVNLMKAYLFPKYKTPIRVGKKVAVVGGGNVAMDAARTALRLGSEVFIIYRRSEEEMPARLEEIHHAKEEGVQFKLLNNPLEILGDDQGHVKGIKCVQMELGAPDESGRRRPVSIKGSEWILDVETVVMAIGNQPNPLLIKATPDLEVTKWGTIMTKDVTGLTSKEGVYAGGDAVTGAATVIEAMGAGKKAAEAIDQYLSCEEQL